MNPYEVSVENNASVLAGLWIFQSLLQDELAYETSLTEGEKGKIEAALTQIDTLLQGLLDFFEKYAWNPSAGIFYQGGDANNPALTEAWVPTSEPKAVDVSTWGVSVLGQSRVDGWYGFGTCYDIWQNVKSWGGFYGPDGALWGVGYSNVDGNGGSGNYAEGILSAEWTAGAINLLRCLITAYEEVALSEKYTPDQRKDAAEFAADLQKDHDSMHQNLMTLRTDLYASTDAYSGVRPAEYDALIPIPEGKRAFLYASKRYMIPFGWVANPLPSTTSTAWAIFLHYQFNPFKWGGSY
ncbi:MAG: hypothetical protein JSS61_05590 [Verrucomicrobia bacterium]|nr:hypothetical protein [Verrucomicrobiota bacterium]